MKWAVELGEYDIYYRSRIATKGQALADFIAKVTLMPKGLEHKIYNIKPQLITYHEEEPSWTQRLWSKSLTRLTRWGAIQVRTPI